MRLPKKTRSQWFALLQAFLAAGLLFYAWYVAWQEGGEVLAAVVIGTVLALVCGFYLIRKMYW